MGIDKMVTRGEMLRSFIILQGNVWSSMQRISVVDPEEASPPYFNNNNNICLFPPFADFSELQVGSGKDLQTFSYTYKYINITT